MRRSSSLSSSLSSLSLALPVCLLALAPPTLAQEKVKQEVEKKIEQKAGGEKSERKAKKGKAKTAVTWLGHAAFEIKTPGGTTLLIDPFLKDNPSTPAAFKDLTRYKPDAILVTHSHQDHKADAAEIAKASGAKVIGAFELISAMKVPDAQKMGGNVGGSFKVGDATISLVPAMHGSEPGGRPLGFVIELDNGKSVYHTGDTWIFSDMKLIQDFYKPDILLLNAGGGPFTQSPDVAKTAVKKFFRPKTIIPMHYGTFPPLASEDDVKKAFGKDRRVKIMKPGETLEL